MLVAMALTLATVEARAQDQASTLDALSRHAACIAQVRVVAITRDDRGETRVTLQSLRTLKGDDPARFVLHEPGARACGRALYGLLPGSTLLVFLDQGATGPELTISNARSLVALEPELVDHLLRLLATRTDNERVSILAAGLGSRSLRVREDSALALPLQAALPLADERARAQIAAALRGSLDRQDRRLYSLMQVATRLQLSSALPLLLDCYLQDNIPGFGRALATLLTRFHSDDLAPALKLAYQRDPQPAARILALAERLPAQGARRLLLQIAENPRRSVALQAGTCLLRGGFAQVDLTNLLGEDLAAACAARARPERPKFRTILLGAGADENHRD